MEHYSIEIFIILIKYHNTIPNGRTLFWKRDRGGDSFKIPCLHFLALFSDFIDCNNNCCIILVIIVLHIITCHANWCCSCRERGARALEERLAAERLAAARRELQREAEENV